MNAFDFNQHEIFLLTIGAVLFLVGLLLIALTLKVGTAAKQDLSERTQQSASGNDNFERRSPEVLEVDVGKAVSSTSVSLAAEKSWFVRLSEGLSKTQNQLVRQLETLFLDSGQIANRESILDSMLEILVRADVGVRTAERLIEKLRTALPADQLGSADAVMATLKLEVLSILSAPAQTSNLSGWSLCANKESGPQVVLMVGVNGVGKTTTTGKLAFKMRQSGKSVIVGAADTFRAAAVDQLEEWAKRSGAECVRMAEGSDPASVAFECVKKALAQNVDLCLVDTAGRLHNRNDLMQELGKVRRVVSKGIAAAPHEVLLVLDATTGQNALQQAKVFREVAGVTGLVLTKLDGTAKGGVAIALAAEMNLPIRFVGVGEAVEDLQQFDPAEFVDALFAHPSKTKSAVGAGAAFNTPTLSS
jgi:fused signal recognition particle receptor